MNKDVYINMLVAITAVLLVMAMGMRLAAAAEPAMVIDLTQTPCQFVESEGLGRLTLPSVSGGGLTPGATNDYVYSCPLNATPDYRLAVIG